MLARSSLNVILLSLGFVYGAHQEVDQPQTNARHLRGMMYHVIDFEGFQKGDWVGNVGYGTTVTAKPLSESSGGCFGSSGDKAMIFDTYDAIKDPDLATTDKGNVLIISEDCKKMRPDDNRFGGIFIFTFDDPKMIVSVGLLDMEKGVTITATKSDGTSVEVTVPGGEYNEYTTFAIDLMDVVVMEVKSTGSGAIADLTIADTKAVAIFGDPHVRGWDGNFFSFQGGCDLVMVHNPSFDNGLGLDINIRTSIVDWYSYIKAAVLRIGDETLEVSTADNGKRITSWTNGMPNEDTTPTSISGYRINYQEKWVSETKLIREYEIDLGDGVVVAIRSFKDLVDVKFRWGAAGYLVNKFAGSVGLLGSFDNGLKLGRDGHTVLTNMNVFGKEWQVRDTEPMLFHDVEGPQYPTICTMPWELKSSEESNSARRRRQLRSGGLVNKDAARTACAHADADVLEHCIFDVLSMNDVDVAAMY